ncbi:hypothetical protein HOY80DRAFT_952703 [Tuber brumale]|nr:hypothetical protein HOY80DRAFT_952703 [Tuber brumale]
MTDAGLLVDKASVYIHASSQNFVEGVGAQGAGEILQDGLQKGLQREADGVRSFISKTIGVRHPPLHLTSRATVYTKRT